jgi:hypothetical protein
VVRTPGGHDRAVPDTYRVIAAHIAELAIQIRRPLEQRQFARVLGQPLQGFRASPGDAWDVL